MTELLFKFLKVNVLLIRGKMESLIIAISLTVSLTVLMGCIWQQLRSRLFRSKSMSNDNTEHKNDSDIENVITDKENEKVSKSNLNIAVNHYKGSEVTQVVDGMNNKNNENNEAFNSFDEAMNACLRAAESLENLEHINKTRPKRSNIRRSSRKSKISLELDLSNNNKNNGNQNKAIVGPDSNDQLKEQISSTLSMFSARIEEVTKPLTPSTPNKQNEFDFNFKASNENLLTTNATTEKSIENIEKPQITLIDRTKRIGSPLLNSAMFAELKIKQKSKINQNNSQNSFKLSDDEISDKNEINVQKVD